MKCKFYYNNIDYCGSNICLNKEAGWLKCPFVDEFEECEFCSEKATDTEDNIITETVVNRPPVKLELVQYPYSKSGATVYLDDCQIAGPIANGVGHTVASYELTKENLKDIQKIVIRQLNRLNEIDKAEDND